MNSRGCLNGQWNSLLSPLIAHMGLIKNSKIKDFLVTRVRVLFIHHYFNLFHLHTNKKEISIEIIVFILFVGWYTQPNFIWFICSTKKENDKIKLPEIGKTKYEFIYTYNECWVICAWKRLVERLDFFVIKWKRK